MGYRDEIATPQERHRPRSSSHDSTGMLSRHWIGVSQTGQCESGCDSDSPLGSRQMTTFANEPKTSPNKASDTKKKASISIAP